MNIHHLELFYYVARHGGISEAVRNIPYGIQQPAVSAQILQLEQGLGVKLFQRRPFLLTPAGDRLFRFVQPFFQNLDNVAEEIRTGGGVVVRIGASEVVLREHLPGLVQRLRQHFPKLKLVLRAGYQPELMEWLRKKELDVALTLLDKNLPAGVEGRPLLQLPLVLLVPKRIKARTLEEFLRPGRISEPLLCLPPNEMICRHFEEGLKSRGIDWPPTAQLSSLELIQTYVENGYGVGLGVAVPGVTFSRKLKVWVLNGFTPVDFGVVWQGEASPLMQRLLQEIEEKARSLVPSTTTSPRPVEKSSHSPARSARPAL